MAQKKPYTVAEVARHAGVSVRTLQYYDEIGLLVAERSTKDYRLYGEEHLLRLQQILIERSHGRSLEDIRRSLDDPSFDHVASLKAQRRRLVERLSETHRAIASIDAALDHLNPMKRKDHDMDLKSLFDGFDPSEFEAEAEKRWGDTDAWSESSQRAKKYGETEWRRIKDEMNSIWSDAAEAMNAGEASDGDVARAIVERHRQHVERWFYPLSPTGHVNLADMWEADDRFKTNIDKFGAGLTPWIASAVRSAAG